jgi:hypothetical protein
LSHVLDEEFAPPRPQYAHSDVKTRAFERRQESEQVPFGSSDAFYPLDVQDPRSIGWHALAPTLRMVVQTSDVNNL